MVVSKGKGGLDLAKFSLDLARPQFYVKPNKDSSAKAHHIKL